MSKVLGQKKALEETLSRGGSTGAKFWKPQSGANRVRIMPGWQDEGFFAGQFWREVYQHWNLSEDQKGPILCPKRTPGLDGDCPVCEFVDELRADKGDLAKKELAKEIRAKVAYFINLVDLNDPEYTAQDMAEWKKSRPEGEVPFEVGQPKVQVYACPTTIFDQILGIITVNGVDITSAEEGYNVVITKYPNKDRFKTRYEVQPELKTSEFLLPSDFELPQLENIGFVMKFDDMRNLLAESFDKDLEDSAGSLGSGGDFSSASNAGSSDDDLEAQMRAELGS